MGKKRGMLYVTNEVKDELIETKKEKGITLQIVVDEILQDIGQQVLNEEGFPEWVKLADVEYVIHLKNNYDFEEWAELANAMFHLDNVKAFLEHDMYVMFLEFIELFDIKLTIKTEKSELKEA